jgi:hypothetical protein
MGAEDVKGEPYQKGNDSEYRDRKGHRNPHQRAHAKPPASTGSREVDLVRSFALTLVLRPVVNNQSFVDAAFRDRKRDFSLTTCDGATSTM